MQEMAYGLKVIGFLTLYDVYRGIVCMDNFGMNDKARTNKVGPYY